MNRKPPTSVACCCFNFNHHAEANSAHSRTFDPARIPSEVHTTTECSSTINMSTCFASFNTIGSAHTSFDHSKPVEKLSACCVGDFPPERSWTPTDSTQIGSLFGLRDKHFRVISTSWGRSGEQLLLGQGSMSR